MSIEDGALVIRADAVRVHGQNSTAFANVTTGGVTSKRSWGGSGQGGPTRICLNAMLPGGGGGGGDGTSQGFWPALWMMPDDSSCWACHGEIDLVEMINGEGYVQSHYHYTTNTTWCAADEKLGCTTEVAQNCTGHGGPCTTGGAAGFGSRGAGMRVPSFGSAYHEYVVEFDGASHVAFAYDGKVIANMTRNSRGGGPKPMFSDVPFYLILDFMIGEAVSWAGAPNAKTVFPAYLRLDSVRVAQPGARGDQHQRSRLPSSEPKESTHTPERRPNSPRDWPLTTGSGSSVAC